jgi:hypothetical protein
VRIAALEAAIVELTADEFCADKQAVFEDAAAKDHVCNLGLGEADVVECLVVEAIGVARPERVGSVKDVAEIIRDLEVFDKRGFTRNLGKRLVELKELSKCHRC